MVYNYNIYNTIYDNQQFNNNKYSVQFFNNEWIYLWECVGVVNGLPKIKLDIIVKV